MGHLVSLCPVKPFPRGRHLLHSVAAIPQNGWHRSNPIIRIMKGKELGHSVIKSNCGKLSQTLGLCSGPTWFYFFLRGWRNSSKPWQHYGAISFHHVGAPQAKICKLVSDGLKKTLGGVGRIEGKALRIQPHLRHGFAFHLDRGKL